MNTRLWGTSSSSTTAVQGLVCSSRLLQGSGGGGRRRGGGERKKKTQVREKPTSSSKQPPPRSLGHFPTIHLVSQTSPSQKRASHDVGENKHERLLMWQENTGWCLMRCKSTHLIGRVFFRTFSTQADGRGKGHRNANTLYTITHWVLA